MGASGLTSHTGLGDKNFDGKRRLGVRSIIDSYNYWYHCVWNKQKACANADALTDVPLRTVPLSK